MNDRGEEKTREREISAKVERKNTKKRKREKKKRKLSFCSLRYKNQRFSENSYETPNRHFQSKSTRVEFFDLILLFRVRSHLFELSLDDQT